MVDDPLPTPETHRYLGMFRPPWEEVLAKMKAVDSRYLQDGNVLLPFSDNYGNCSGTFKLKEWWLAGYYDAPQYELKETATQPLFVLMPGPSSFSSAPLPPASSSS